jgi:uncharacterized membrane protein YhaH (DUF805 family)
MTGFSAATAPASPPLDEPHYRIGPVGAVSRFFRKYATFSGRAGRAEYWWASLFIGLVYLVLSLGGLAAGMATGQERYDGSVDPGIGLLPFAILLLVFVLACVVPGIALVVRRLHDANFSGLLYLINFVPYVGGLALCVFALLPPNPLGARYDVRQPGAYPAS